ncbi:DUF4406 domain-containing protein [Candidatus Wolfebacteria bacterium]|nr:DUF4406 domain-containing protein [Candidatus Wolfebacteria bacterium]
MNNQYWEKNDLFLLKKAKSLKDLVKIAERVLIKIPNPRAQLCGPISTGGTGNVKTNIKNLQKSIKILESKGVNIFNHLKFEPILDKLSINWEQLKPYPDIPILEDFYGKIFETKLLNIIYFLPNWETSLGAKWEYNYANKLGIKIFVLSNNWKKNTL